MNTKILITAIVLGTMSITTTIAQQKEMSHKEHQEMRADTYVCPMHPEVTSNKQGDCSKCGMKLVKKEHKGEAMYVCPMHSDITSNKQGDCPKCGMALVKKEQKEKKIKKSMYVCPMHPKVTSNKPGNCHKCGMNLKKEKHKNK